MFQYVCLYLHQLVLISIYLPNGGQKFNDFHLNKISLNLFHLNKVSDLAKEVVRLWLAISGVTLSHNYLIYANINYLII